MSSYTIARVKRPDRDAIPVLRQDCKQQSYVIFRDGEKIGELRHRYRPKNAGGPAWCGTLMPTDLERQTGSAGTSVYSRDKQKVLDWFKGGPAPG